MGRLMAELWLCVEISLPPCVIPCPPPLLYIIDCPPAAPCYFEHTADRASEGRHASQAI